jgi:hypothetical protein
MKNWPKKAIDRDENYNFVVDEFFYLKSFEVLKVWQNFWRFEIPIYQTILGLK